MRRFFRKFVKRESNSADVAANVVEVESTETAHMLTTIVNLKSRLSGIIEPDFGLLDHLLRLEVLTRGQHEDIRSERRAACRRSEAVLDLLETEEQCGKFVTALQRTEQQHVINLITENGGQHDIT